MRQNKSATYDLFLKADNFKVNILRQSFSFLNHNSWTYDWENQTEVVFYSFSHMTWCIELTLKQNVYAIQHPKIVTACCLWMNCRWFFFEIEIMVIKIIGIPKLQEGPKTNKNRKWKEIPSTNEKMKMNGDTEQSRIWHANVKTK